MTHFLSQQGEKRNLLAKKGNFYEFVSSLNIVVLANSPLPSLKSWLRHYFCPCIAIFVYVRGFYTSIASCRWPLIMIFFSQSENRIFRVHNISSYFKAFSVSKIFFRFIFINVEKEKTNHHYWIFNLFSSSGQKADQLDDQIWNYASAILNMKSNRVKILVTKWISSATTQSSKY